MCVRRLYIHAEIVSVFISRCRTDQSMPPWFAFSRRQRSDVDDNRLSLMCSMPFATTGEQCHALDSMQSHTPSTTQFTSTHAHTSSHTELSMGWVDPWVGLGWVGSTVAKVLKI